MIVVTFLIPKNLRNGRGADRNTDKQDISHQEQLDGPQDVHGSSEGGPQVEADPHCSPKLRAQRTRYHVVGASSYIQTQQC